MSLAAISVRSNTKNSFSQEDKFNNTTILFKKHRSEVKRPNAIGEFIS